MTGLAAAASATPQSSNFATPATIRLSRDPAKRMGLKPQSRV
jgi:hypothetical protein